MATPLAGSQVQSTAGANAGQGASAVVVAATESGDRGACSITLGPGAAAGVLATINFGGATPDTGMRGRITSVIPGSGMLAVGSLADPDIRPIVLTVYPAPPMGVHFQAVPIISGPQMAGFQILASGAMGPGGTFTFAWAVL